MKHLRLRGESFLNGIFMDPLFAYTSYNTGYLKDWRLHTHDESCKNTHGTRQGTINQQQEKQ